jgi:hypothetical protein
MLYCLIGRQYGTVQTVSQEEEEDEEEEVVMVVAVVEYSISTVFFR